jgi:hypothetical protein
MASYQYKCGHFNLDGGVGLSVVFVNAAISITHGCGLPFLYGYEDGWLLRHRLGAFTHAKALAWVRVSCV